MKFFGLFKDKASAPSEYVASKDKQSLRDSASRSSTSSRRRSSNSLSDKKNRRNSSGTSLPVPETTRDANAFQTTEKLMAVMNDYDPENPQVYIDAFCDLFQKGKKGKILAEDGDCHTAEECATLLTWLHNACPNDYKMIHTKIVKEDKDHFTVEGVAPCGTHNGAALTIMPGVLPAVPPSGKFVSLDVEYYRCFMNKDGTKIKHVEVISMGNLTGFAGFYEGCGGSLAPPPPKEEEEKQ